MTNRQNNDNTENFSESASDAEAKHIVNDEYISYNGPRTKTEKDDKSIMDDVNDYVFTRHRKVRVTESGKGKKSVKRKKITHRKKKMKRWKKVLIGIGCTLLSLIILIVGTFMFLVIKGGNELLGGDFKITAPTGVEAQIQDDGEYIVYKGRTYQLNKNITSILFMGVDKRELQTTEVNGTGGQADVLVLMAYDTKSGKISMINISRDTMTDVTVYSANGGYVGSETQQICLSYAYGDGKKTSCDNTVNSVKRLFYNIPIRSYLALDLDGIAAVNDSIGGVDVTSPETVGGFTAGQIYHLEGALSESFVRARGHESADANTLRMQRQQIYATEFMNKMISKTKQQITTPVDLFNASSPYTCTNLNPSKITYLAMSAVMSNGMSVEMKTVPGTAKMGKTYAEYYINEEQFFELFLSVYYFPK